jgi:hypothetical protein
MRHHLAVGRNLAAMRSADKGAPLRISALEKNCPSPSPNFVRDLWF